MAVADVEQKLERAVEDLNVRILQIRTKLEFLKEMLNYMNVKTFRVFYDEWDDLKGLIEGRGVEKSLERMLYDIEDLRRWSEEVRKAEGQQR